MKKAIYVSINDKSVTKIVSKIKNHEFRNYLPKKEFDTLYVYTTSPVSKIQYIINIGKVLKYPEQISYDGDCNVLFNNGEKSKYAYEIKEVYALKYPIDLKKLKDHFKFMPPQSYAYEDRYKELSDYIESQEKELIWRSNNDTFIKHK